MNSKFSLPALRQLVVRFLMFNFRLLEILHFAILLNSFSGCSPAEKCDVTVRFHDVSFLKCIFLCGVCCTIPDIHLLALILLETLVKQHQYCSNISNYLLFSFIFHFGALNLLAK